jgi:hypothetical protein
MDLFELGLDRVIPQLVLVLLIESVGVLSAFGHLHAKLACNFSRQFEGLNHAGNFSIRVEVESHPFPSRFLNKLAPQTTADDEKWVVCPKVIRFHP